MDDYEALEHRFASVWLYARIAGVILRVAAAELFTRLRNRWRRLVFAIQD